MRARLAFAIRPARFASLALSGVALALATCAPGPGSAPGRGAAEATGDRLWGVTIDDVSSIDAITRSLGALPVKPIARVVFDEHVPASDYRDAVRAIRGVSLVMGEILDSSAVHEYTPAAYAQRTSEYLDAFGDRIDLWEVANEINGEWVCDQDAEHCTEAQTAAVVTKMTAAFDRVKDRGAAAALTLYYNRGCASDPANEVFTWAAANVPPRMKRGLDYVFFSYYEDDCDGLEPDWQSAFSELATMFPRAKLGIGECGTADPSRKAALVDRYYRMTVSVPRFVGGYFWWYFREDMVPETKPLWPVLARAMAAGATR